MIIQFNAQAEQNILKCKQLCNRWCVRFSRYSMEPEQTFYKRLINACSDYDLKMMKSVNWG